MTRRLAVLGVAILALVAAGGCTESESGGQFVESTESEAPAPRWSPINDATEFETLPKPVKEEPSLEQVTNDTAGDQTRTGAEEFALNAARLLMDVRTDAEPSAVIDAIFAVNASREVRTYAYQQLVGQVELGRRVESADEQWIRSAAQPSSGAPETASVEVALNLVVPGLEFQTWGIVRIDAEWGDGRWYATGFAEGPSGPKAGEALTPAEQADFLVGPGWRRIAPCTGADC